MSLSEPLLPLRPNHKGGGLCVQNRAQAYQQQEVAELLGGDCDLLPPPLVLNLGPRKERPALSGAFFPPALAFCPWALPMGVRRQACEGNVLRGAFPPVFSISCFSFPYTMISPAQRSLALTALMPLMHALPGSPFPGLHLLQGPSP